MLLKSMNSIDIHSGKSDVWYKLNENNFDNYCTSSPTPTFLILQLPQDHCQKGLPSLCCTGFLSIYLMFQGKMNRTGL